MIPNLISTPLQTTVEVEKVNDTFIITRQSTEPLTQSEFIQRRDSLNLQIQSIQLQITQLNMTISSLQDEVLKYNSVLGG